MEKRKPFYAVCGKVHYQQQSGEVYCVSQKYLRNKATEHTALPLMGVYLRKPKTPQDTCNPTFTAALFTRASTRIQPKFPCKENMDKEDVILMYNGILVSHEINVKRLVAAR